MDPLTKARNHLKETDWTYWQHFRHSVKQSNRLIVIAVKSYIHGLLPWLYPSSGPVGIYQIYREIRKLHHVQKMFQRHDNEN